MRYGEQRDANLRQDTTITETAVTDCMRDLAVHMVLDQLLNTDRVNVSVQRDVTDCMRDLAVHMVLDQLLNTDRVCVQPRIQRLNQLSC